MKLLSKLLLGIITLMILSGLAIGGISYIKSSNSTNDILMSTVDTELSLRAQIIEEKLENAKKIITVLTEDDRILSALKSGEYSTDTSAVLTVTASNNKDLISLIALADSVDNVVLSDAANPNAVGLNISDRAYLKQAKETKNIVISDIIISRADDSSSIVIACPIYDQGKYLGLLLSTIKFSIISDIVDAAKISSEGYAYMIDITGDNVGAIVAHPNKDYILNEQNLYDFNEPELTETLNQMLINKEGESHYSFQGKNKYVKYIQVENWVLAVTANESDLTAVSDSIRNLTILIVILSVVICGIVGYFLVQGFIVEPIQIIENAMKKASNGDLDISLENESKDEIGSLSRSFMSMLDNIHHVIESIDTASNEVTNGSKQVSDSSLSLSQGATEQASSVQELLATMQEIAEQTNMNSKTAKDALNIVELSIAHAKEGNQQMHNMLEAMSKINGSSRDISKIIKMIDDIAFQTNILALNAAVEAARAGQHGKGFAVVAEEVRNLAARSSQAAKETTTLIDESENDVKIGMSLAEATTTSLELIVANIIETESMMKKIVSASESQAINVSHTNIGLSEISEVVQTTSATAQETAAASEELLGQADLLKEQVKTFHLRTTKYKALSSTSSPLPKLREINFELS